MLKRQRQVNAEVARIVLLLTLATAILQRVQNWCVLQMMLSKKRRIKNCRKRKEDHPMQRCQSLRSLAVIQALWGVALPAAV
jgi:1,4-dihydroxy-2-naphthoate octaprenyltransferase